jgi:tRNA(His) 5'-end guanylyltransferase
LEANARDFRRIRGAVGVRKQNQKEFKEFGGKIEFGSELRRKGIRRIRRPVGVRRQNQKEFREFAPKFIFTS